jgi:hypothetical protein
VELCIGNSYIVCFFAEVQPAWIPTQVQLVLLSTDAPFRFDSVCFAPLIPSDTSTPEPDQYQSERFVVLLPIILESELLHSARFVLLLRADRSILESDPRISFAISASSADPSPAATALRDFFEL